MGKTIMLYLSISLAFIPKSLSGGACTAGDTDGGGTGGEPATLNVNFESFNCEQYHNYSKEFEFLK